MYFKIRNFLSHLSLKKFPKKIDILYFDYVDKNLSKIIIKNRNFDYIFSDKKRELNFFLILLIFINFNSLKILFFENFTTAYAYIYILFSRSKIVLTTGDNNLNFYRLKNYHKNIKFVAIQNGSRHRINDIFDFDHINNFNKEKKICSDLILTFNNSISKLFEKYFCSKTISIGKFINNSIRVFDHHIYTNKVIYISQFRERNFKSLHFKSHGKKVCSIKQFYEVERKLMPILNKYCSKNRLELVIMGNEKSKNARNKEKKFYNLHIGNSAWKYWNRDGNLNERYKFISRFSIIICSWSTLGVEMFSRNCKVAFFRPRNVPPYNDRTFGWPANFPNKGFWYTSFITQPEVDRVLNNLLNIKKNDWIAKINLVKNKIMKFDANNTILRDQLDSMLNYET